MNKRKFVRLVFAAVCVLAVVYPLVVWFGEADLEMESEIWFEIFPVFGLIAFSTMWLHIVGGALRSWLETYLNFQKFVDITAIVVLVSLIAHPLLLYVGLFTNGGGSPFAYTSDGKEYLIWLAIVGWLIFTTYDVLKKFKEREFFARHWQAIKFISTAAFFLVLIHSLGIGRDLEEGGLRLVWWFYGLTAGLATIKNYVMPVVSGKR